MRTVLGEDAADALARAREAVDDGHRRAVAVGGDGMVSLALQAVAGTGTPLGVVAVGTGNDFARALRPAGARPGRRGRAGRRGAQGRAGPATSTSGRVGDRWFGTVLASGFDSRVNDRGNRMRWPARPASSTTWRCSPNWPPSGPSRTGSRSTTATVQEIEATLVAVGNGSSYGGGMRICAGAGLDDGLFDVTVVGDCSRTTLLRVFPRVYRGTHLDHPAVTVHRAAQVELAAAGTSPGTRTASRSGRCR